MAAGATRTASRSRDAGLLALAVLAACGAGGLPGDGGVRTVDGIETETTAEATVQTLRVGPITARYATGRDAGPDDPVHRMPLGVITLRNDGPAPVRVRYNALRTFELDHLVEIGEPPVVYRHPRTREVPEEDRIDHMLAPGAEIPVSNRSFMAPYYRLGRVGLRDGRLCTSFSSLFMVDESGRDIAFGPICFAVAMDRDWSAVEAAYEASLAKP